MGPVFRWMCYYGDCLCKKFGRDYPILDCCFPGFFLSSICSPLCFFSYELFHIVGPLLSGLGPELPLMVFWGCLSSLNFARDSSLLDCWLSCFCLSGGCSPLFPFSFQLFYSVGTLLWRLGTGLWWRYFCGNSLHYLFYRLPPFCTVFFFPIYKVFDLHIALFFSSLLVLGCCFGVLAQVSFEGVFVAFPPWGFYKGPPPFGLLIFWPFFCQDCALHFVFFLLGYFWFLGNYFETWI